MTDPSLPLDPLLAYTEGVKCLTHRGDLNDGRMHPDAHPVLQEEYKRGELVQVHGRWLYRYAEPRS